MAAAAGATTRSSRTAGVRLLLTALLCLACARVARGEDATAEVDTEPAAAPSFDLGALRSKESWLRRFSLYDWRAALQLGFEWNRQDSSPASGADVSTENMNFREQIGLGSSGFFFHPSLCEFSTDVVLNFNQNQSSSPGADTSLDTRLIGFSAGATFLRTQPYSLWVFGNRGENVVSREFGSTTKILAQNYGATLRIKAPFRAELGVRQERLQQEETLIDTPPQDDERRVAFVHGSRQGEVSDVGGSYDFQDVTDHTQPDLNFLAHSANVSHRYAFGEYLEKEMSSSLRAFWRDGSVNLKAIGVGEHLTVNHTDNVSSNYSYGFDLNEDDQFRDTRHQGGFSLDHRLFGSLRNRLGVTGSYWEPQGGRITQYAPNAGSDYSKRLPGDGVFSLGGNVSYGVTDQHLQGGDVAVFAEPHVVVGFQPIFLDNPRVILDSIGVTDSTGTRLFQEGFDYQVIEFGDRVALQRLPAGRFDDGMTIVADYVFLSTGTLKYATLGRGVRVGLEYPWVSLFFRRFDSEHHLREGSDAFLDDTTDQVAGLGLRWSAERVDAFVNTEYRWYESSTLDYRGPRLLESIVARPFDRLSLNATFSQVFSDYSVPQDRDTTELSARLTSTWLALRTLQVELATGWLRIEDSAIGAESVVDGALRLQWELGRMRVTPQLSAARREIGGSSSTGVQATLWVSRQIL